jgi:peptidoglycan/LPS O-acetylase OafA/YrhL
MTIRRIAAVYAMLVGAAVIGLWTALLLAGDVPELETSPLEIRYHLAAELLTGVTLVASGAGLWRGRRWAERTFTIALGMLLYTVINSAGYYADLGEATLVGLFTALTALTVVLVWTVVTRPALFAVSGDESRGSAESGPSA